MSEPQPPCLGPRKRKKSSRVTENADPLLPKNKKTKVAQKANPTGQPKAPDTTKGKRARTASSRHSSVEIEDVADKPDVEAADGSDNVDGDDSAPVWIDVDDGEDEKPEDSADAELRACTSDSDRIFSQLPIEQLMKDWSAPVYAFFKPIPTIDHIEGRRVHIFTCTAKSCKGKGRNGRDVRRFLSTSDSTSTSNLRRHAKVCWSEATIKAAGRAKDAHAARSVLAKSYLRDSSITAAFERIGKESVTYSHRQHTRTKSR